MTRAAGAGVIENARGRQLTAQGAEEPRLEDMTEPFCGGGLEGVDHDHYLYRRPKRAGARD